MGKRLTVFYSWQSDSPSSLNRKFIENALHEALKRLHTDAALENALRDATIELDRDTKGVAGSPPITETILQKIEECTVFVADLTFVGQSKGEMKNSSGKPRQFPNPNVLIEYGYALRCHSHRKMIGVMNTAFGKPDSESLPFDLRHLRWPITYRLADASSSDKEEQFEKLVSILVEAVGLILGQHSSKPQLVEKFTPQKASKSPAVFFEKADELATDRTRDFGVPEGAKAFLRLYPTQAVTPIRSELEARDLATKGTLAPFGEVSSWGYERNVFGALAYEQPLNGKCYNFTQLFLSREIWGVDAKCVNSERLVHRFEGYPGPYIANGFIEKYFRNTLTNYLKFAREHLNLQTPLQIEAGFVGIKGYPITVDSFNIEGNSLHDSVHWTGSVESYEKPAGEILKPFFERIWENCGLTRPTR